MKCGITIEQYWEMTPKEVYQVIRAVSWRMAEDQKDLAWLAWHFAALSRAKRLPPLSALLSSNKTKKLHGDELEKRRKEFADLKERMNAKITTR